MQSKYRHELMMVNTSPRSMNSVSEHGNMVTPMKAYSHCMKCGIYGGIRKAYTSRVRKVILMCKDLYR